MAARQNFSSHQTQEVIRNCLMTVPGKIGKQAGNGLVHKSPILSCSRNIPEILPRLRSAAVTPFHMCLWGDMPKADAYSVLSPTPGYLLTVESEYLMLTQKTCT